MSPRAKRIAYGVVVFVVGTAIVAPVVLSDVPNDFIFLGALCELALLIVGGGIAFTKPPAPVQSVEEVDEVVDAPAPPAGPSTAYRGALPPSPIALLPVSKASAKRITLGVLAALAFTAAAVPFALHLPRWIEIEVVIGLWWAMWSVVLAVIAYRGTRIDDDHRANGSANAAKAVDLPNEPVKPKWSWLLEGIADPEGCLIAIVVLAVVGIAMLGAWLVVELAAPAVFVVAYRCVVKALAKAHAANARGDAPRAALTGMGWAAAHTAPLAAVVALAHALFV